MKNIYYLYLSIFTFGLSLVAPFYFPQDDDFFGFHALIMGWITFPTSDFFCWLANFTLLFAWIFHTKQASYYLAWLTFLLMLPFGIDHLTKFELFQVQVYEEFLFAYWFWLLSAISMLYFGFKSHQIRSLKP